MRKNKERDETIKSLYKRGRGGILGRRYGITRQRVGQIVHKKQDGFWGRLIDKVLYIFLAY